jgi:hypothetical protein
MGAVLTFGFRKTFARLKEFATKSVPRADKFVSTLGLGKKRGNRSYAARQDVEGSRLTITEWLSWIKRAVYSKDTGES